MTDAAHLLTDVGSMSVSLFSLWVSTRPPTKTMSFGWHRSGETPTTLHPQGLGEGRETPHGPGLVCAGLLFGPPGLATEMASSVEPITQDALAGRPTIEASLLLP